MMIEGYRLFLSEKYKNSKCLNNEQGMKIISNRFALVNVNSVSRENTRMLTFKPVTEESLEETDVETS